MRRVVTAPHARLYERPWNPGGAHWVLVSAPKGRDGRGGDCRATVFLFLGEPPVAGVELRLQEALALAIYSEAHARASWAALAHEGWAGKARRLRLLLLPPVLVALLLALFLVLAHERLHGLAVARAVIIDDAHESVWPDLRLQRKEHRGDRWGQLVSEVKEKNTGEIDGDN